MATIEISTAQEWLDLITSDTGTTKDDPLDVILKNDIDFTGVTEYSSSKGLAPIHNSMYYGTINGNGHKFNNLNITSFNDSLILIPFQYIKNIILDNITITVQSNTSQICMFLGDITNVKIMSNCTFSNFSNIIIIPQNRNIHTCYIAGKYRCEFFYLVGNESGYFDPYRFNTIINTFFCAEVHCGFYRGMKVSSTEIYHTVSKSIITIDILNSHYIGNDRYIGFAQIDDDLNPQYSQSTMSALVHCYCANIVKFIGDISDIIAQQSCYGLIYNTHKNSQYRFDNVIKCFYDKTLFPYGADEKEYGIPTEQLKNREFLKKQGWLI